LLHQIAKARRERAAAGDIKAQRQLLFMGLKQRQIAKKTLARKARERTFIPVPRGLRRLSRRDPVTHELVTMDIDFRGGASGPHTFDVVMHKIAACLPWRHLAPRVTDEQAEFIDGVVHGL
jgi:hypothetical protein